MQSREGHKQKVRSSKRESLVRLIKKTEERKKKKNSTESTWGIKKGISLNTNAEVIIKMTKLSTTELQIFWTLLKWMWS